MSDFASARRSSKRRLSRLAAISGISASQTFADEEWINQVLHDVGRAHEVVDADQHQIRLAGALFHAHALDVDARLPVGQGLPDLVGNVAVSRRRVWCEYVGMNSATEGGAHLSFAAGR